MILNFGYPHWQFYNLSDFDADIYVFVIDSEFHFVVFKNFRYLFIPFLVNLVKLWNVQCNICIVMRAWLVLRQ